MGKIKLRIAVIALIAMLITMMGQASLAYYSVVGKATNVVTAGNISFKIHETTDQGTPFPEEGVYIVPGDIVSKRVTIENICDHPFYLRVKIVYGIDAVDLPVDHILTPNINTKYWEYHDGWYYYKGIVEPGMTTPHVFSQVEVVGEEFSVEYLGHTLTLTVKAHAVQSANNPLVDGKFYTASGWPKE